MVSKAFFKGSKLLVEDSDGREDYFRFNGERFLRALSKSGQQVVRAPFDADEPKTEYLKVLVRLNEAYFEARSFETDASGKFYKHDEMSERRFRVVVAERLTDRVDDLHALLDAHEALVAAGVERAGTSNADADGGHAPGRLRTGLLACTERALTGGWFPTVEAYYYSLSPGEIVSEGRERRKQRIEGTEETPGIREMLGKFTFQRLTERDLTRIRDVNVRSPGPDAEVWKRLQNRYSWYIEYDRSPAASGDAAAEDPAGRNGEARFADREDESVST